MDCQVIQDLIPLCVDACCSEQSHELVRAHIAQCEECKAVYDRMSEPTETVVAVPSSTVLHRVTDWKASVLQSVLLFVSFAIITVGVALEAATPSGLANSIWALRLVIPATGFMLSLINWYFVKFYKSRKAFSAVSCLLTLGITLCGYVWAMFHYELTALFTLQDAGAELVGFVVFQFGFGVLFTALNVVLSNVLSSRYAKWLGKE